MVNYIILGKLDCILIKQNIFIRVKEAMKKENE